MGGKGSGRPGGNPDLKKHSPMVQSASYNADPDTNRRIINFLKAVRELPPTDFADPESIVSTFYAYLEICADYSMRPTVSSTSIALKITQGTYTDIVQGVNHTWGGITEAGILEIKNTYEFLSGIYETNLVEEKGSPVKWIFLGKNRFGFKDQVENVQIKVDATKMLGSSEEAVQKYRQIAGADGEYEVPEDGKA